MQIGLYSPRHELLEQQLQAIHAFNQTACLDLTVHTYQNHRALEQAATNIPLDILSYDMDCEEARERLKRIVHTLPNCRVFLLSASEQHAVFGYAIHAAGYLLLPLDNEELISTLVHLLRERIQAKEQFLPVKINGVWSQVNMRHITHLESRGHNLIFHLNNQTQLKASASFRDYQSLLDLNTDFLRCHKSYMVNLQYVKNWEMDHFLLENGSEINISRPYWQTVRSVYACYLAQAKSAPLEMQSEAKNVPAKEAGNFRR